MAVLPVLKEPHPLLRRVSQPVTSFTGDIVRLLDDMVETMRAEEGVGLSAPQVGVLCRVVVMQVAPDKPVHKMLNPEILWADKKMVPSKEGCLSVPGAWAEVARPASVEVRFATETGEVHEQLFTGLGALCVQHEMDHLQGKLFIDYLSPLRRTQILKKLRQSIVQ